MSYRNITLYLAADVCGEKPVCVDYAALLAQHCGAHLTGLLSRPRLPMAYHYIPHSVIEEHKANLELAARTARDAFQASLAGYEISGEWIEYDGGALEAIHVHGRVADLLVIGQAGCKSEDRILGDEYGAELLRNDAVLDLGRPVLVLPAEANGSAQVAGMRILAAWNGSKEATRAVHDALPLLKRAGAVTVLCINSDGAAQESGGLLVRHLAQHDVAAELSVLRQDRTEIGELILSEAARHSADLLVMGAYGHVRWREVVFGGATETVLADATIPVLFSH